jgi:hypothetical protein
VVWGGDIYSVGSLRRDPVDVPFPAHLTETDPVSATLCCLVFEYWTMDGPKHLENPVDSTLQQRRGLEAVGDLSRVECGRKIRSRQHFQDLRSDAASGPVGTEGSAVCGAVPPFNHLAPHAVTLWRTSG